MGAPSSLSIKRLAFSGENAGTLSWITLHKNHSDNKIKLVTEFKYFRACKSAMMFFKFKKTIPYHK